MLTTSFFRRLLAVVFVTLASHAACASASAPKSFQVTAGPAEKSLVQFQTQAGVQVVYPTDRVQGIRTNAVQGELTPRAALEKMVAGTPLVVVVDEKTGALGIRRESSEEGAKKNAPSRPASDRTADQPEGGVIKLDTFEVMGTKLLNMDIRRTRDDAQPYVVFNRDTITNSGATNLEDFFKQRLTMNSTGLSNSQAAALAGNLSTVNLRGLGAGQTLILVDGHRVASPAVSSLGPQQSDLNGIPLAAIERIEVLPSTASGIYGGGATGGVINVILRRDYAGAEVQVTYDNTFDRDAAIRRVDFSAGLTLEKGRTNILLAGSYRDGNSLVIGDRDFSRRGIDQIMANNPASILTATFPPLGATTNIRSVNGSPLFGPGTANFTSVPTGYANTGGQAALLAALQTNAGRYNLGLAPMAINPTGSKGGLANNPVIKSGSLTVRRQFSSHVQAFLELAASDNRGSFPFVSISNPSYTLAATAPNNPFGQAVRVTVPLSGVDTTFETLFENRRILTGAIIKLPRDWQGQFDVTWNRSTFSDLLFAASTGADTAAVTTGAVDIFRDTTLFPLDFSSYLTAARSKDYPLTAELWNYTIRAAGPVATLPAGPVVLSSLLEHRREEFGESFIFSAAGALFQVPSRSITQTGFYLETKVPLVSTINSRSGLRELTLQLAGRYDDYTTKGATSFINVTSTAPVIRATNKNDSFNPTVALSYRPARDLQLRASYGTGFLPPTTQQLATSSPNGAILSLPDPRRGNTMGSFTNTLGGNPGLKPEKSESISAGLIWTPKNITHLRFSVDYVRIKKTDNIVSPTPQQVVDNESLWPERVTRGPNLAGDPAGWAGPITNVDSRVVNLASATVEAYDFALDYRWETTSWGTLDFNAAATRTTDFTTQLFSFSPEVQGLGILSSRPQKWRANGGITWQRSNLTLGWATRYYDSYLASTSAAVLVSQGNGGRVNSQVFHDVFARWKFPGITSGRHGWRGLLRGTEIQVGLKNVFNAAPAFDAGAVSAGYYSYLADPRLASYYISLKKIF